MVLDGAIVFFVHAPEKGGFRLAVPAPADARVLGLVIDERPDGGLDVAMSADGAEIGRGPIEARVPGIITTNGEWLTVGYSTDFPVSEAYRPPFVLDGLEAVVIDAGPPKLPEFEELMAEMMRHQ